MNVRETIKMLCDENGVSIKKLEKDVGLSNGSLMKSDSIKADKLKQIADYFDVSMDYIMAWENIEWKPETQEIYRENKDRIYLSCVTRNGKMTLPASAMRNLSLEVDEELKEENHIAKVPYEEKLIKGAVNARSEERMKKIYDEFKDNNELLNKLLDYAEYLISKKDSEKYAD